MTAILAYLPFLLTALAMTTLTAAYAAPRGMRKRTVLDAFLLNLTTHPAAVALCVGLPNFAFYAVEMLIVGVHAGWYCNFTGLSRSRAVRVSVLSNVVGQVLGNLAMLGLYLATK